MVARIAIQTFPLELDLIFYDVVDWTDMVAAVAFIALRAIKGEIIAS